MTDDAAPTLLWLRRDLRLSDHPGWAAALGRGRDDASGPVIPVFILDPAVEGNYGAAPLWRLGQSLSALAATLAERGSRLTLRRGAALAELRRLATETGARRVVWTRLHEPAAAERDREIAASLGADGIEVTTVPGFLLHPPDTVATAEGEAYRVFTPFWRAVRERAVPEPLTAPGALAPPGAWPKSAALEDWALGRAMGPGAAVVARHAAVGEAAAEGRLGAFIAHRLAGYAEARDRLDRPGTSGLAENLTYGEISPRRIWHAVSAAAERERSAARAAEAFLRQLAWRDFGWHLMHHAPQLETAAWRRDWDRFPWRDDNEAAERWRRGRTGVALVDAAMRQLYVTGTMHNRARMVVASFLTKHLLTHWKLGADWFRDCLIDWDPASNALGWQWVAGSGPDAAPYFRVFNPETQAARFDPDGTYRARFLAEGQARPGAEALAFYEAAPRRWALSPDDPPPTPVIGLKKGRVRALDAWERFRKGG